MKIIIVNTIPPHLKPHRLVMTGEVACKCLECGRFLADNDSRTLTVIEDGKITYRMVPLCRECAYHYKQILNELYELKKSITEKIGF